MQMNAIWCYLILLISNNKFYQDIKQFMKHSMCSTEAFGSVAMEQCYIEDIARGLESSLLTKYDKILQN